MLVIIKESLQKTKLCFIVFIIGTNKLEDTLLNY